MADHSTLATIKAPTQHTRWSGFATPEGTAEFATGSIHGFKHHPAHFRRFNLTLDPAGADLTLSSLGTGTYLGDADDKTDEAVENAVVRAVGDGWNVIDSAPVYREGRGEVAVGRALAALRMMGGCRREHLFVSTKTGVAASPQVLTDFVATFKDVSSGGGADNGGEVVTEEDVFFGLSCWHPLWLEASLDRSLDALQIDTIDMYYLHNPAEMLLPQVSRDEFWQKMRAAFVFCEKARKEGRIKAYGLATWDCCRVSPENKVYVALEEVVKLAEEVGGGEDQHGFRGVMLPVNSGMREAFEEKWQTIGDGKENVTLLEAAKKLGIAVFCSGPLAESSLLKDETLISALDEKKELAQIDGAGTKLVQIARSFPGVLSVMVGHKTPVNVDRNISLTRVAPLTEEEFSKVLENLPVLAAKKHE